MFNPYKLTELKTGVYQFTTDFSVVYSVYFGDGQNYFYDYPEFAGEVLTFGFDRLSSHDQNYFDIKVRYTIIHLIIQYLETHQDKILFFVCDSADSKGTGRMRIFQHWYRQLQVADLEKHDETIDTGDMLIHCSIILHSNNNMRNHILSSFRHLSHSTAQKLKSY
ncbi:DUF6169 family protein [Chitinophaga solisilvae]|uniref:Uncharacterized protein n=1 Tax=Chitinophaga solisilvae TaxID=1233460 RepID=A0A3S1D0K0_9BACT|nr:DUF6169 family protein [Chitinophaga solisilvae]NSL88544.1 hypothetical protein [Chitinophaga solisilvae]